MYLNVLVIGQARRNAGESVVVEVQLSQVGNISQRAIFHRADLIVAQTKPAGKEGQGYEPLCGRRQEHQMSCLNYHQSRAHAQNMKLWEMAPVSEAITFPFYFSNMSKWKIKAILCSYPLQNILLMLHQSSLCPALVGSLWCNQSRSYERSVS